MSEFEPITAHLLPSAAALAAAEWNALAGSDNPFMQHGFFQALEESGSASADTGWVPCHFVVREGGETGPAKALMPAYIKTHSQGEYVFDYSWADAYHRAGGDYYPKLQASVPFTPATGPRLLASNARDKEALLRGAQNFIRQKGISGLHLTFLEEDDRKTCASAGLAIRTDQQFHWVNDSYDDFDGFLSALSSRKRKNIRKERVQALSAGLDVEHLTGTDITEAHWDAYYDFYQDTGARKWGQPYLNRAFFSLLSQYLGDRVLLIMAKNAGRYVAGALNMIGETTLFGRYWGAIEHHPCLHFELCYYQAIDYAIGQGLKTVEAGAQGEHKLARGYVPTTTYSAHWLSDPNFHRAVEDFLVRERDAVCRHKEALEQFTPFKLKT
ncbi:MAG: GNAT family N-acetyltransferase [Pseudomonadota bacterium]